MCSWYWSGEKHMKCRKHDFSCVIIPMSKNLQWPLIILRINSSYPPPPPPGPQAIWLWMKICGSSTTLMVWTCLSHMSSFLFFIPTMSLHGGYPLGQEHISLPLEWLHSHPLALDKLFPVRESLFNTCVNRLHISLPVQSLHGTYQNPLLPCLFVC